MSLLISVPYRGAIITDKSGANSPPTPGLVINYLWAADGTISEPGFAEAPYGYGQQIARVLLLPAGLLRLEVGGAKIYAEGHVTRTALSHWARLSADCVVPRRYRPQRACAVGCLWGRALTNRGAVRRSPLLITVPCGGVMEPGKSGVNLTLAPGTLINYRWSG